MCALGWNRKAHCNELEDLGIEFANLVGQLHNARANRTVSAGLTVIQKASQLHKMWQALKQNQTSPEQLAAVGLSVGGAGAVSGITAGNIQINYLRQQLRSNPNFTFDQVHQLI